LLIFIRLFLASRVGLIAENLFLRRQLALFQERKAKPRRTTASLRLAMVVLAKFFDWRDALVIVKPETFLRWHRTAFKMFWRWRSRKRGRPALPKNIRELVRQMARENPTWGEERIANELSLKLGIRVSPRTVGKYVASGQPRGICEAVQGFPKSWKFVSREHFSVATRHAKEIDVIAVLQLLVQFPKVVLRGNATARACGV
jgi:hypothetical protein